MVALFGSLSRIFAMGVLADSWSSSVDRVLEELGVADVRRVLREDISKFLRQVLTLSSLVGSELFWQVGKCKGVWWRACGG